jgi:hypothetical protein
MSAYDYSELPEGLRDGVRRWIEDHVLPGGFLTAVLEGDLYAAAARADGYNKLALAKVAVWVLWYAPPDCYGSSEKVEAWAAAVPAPY